LKEKEEVRDRQTEKRKLERENKKCRIFFLQRGEDKEELKAKRVKGRKREELLKQREGNT